VLYCLNLHMNTQHLALSKARQLLPHFHFFNLLCAFTWPPDNFAFCKPAKPWPSFWSSAFCVHACCPHCFSILIASGLALPVVPASSLIYTGTCHRFLPTRPMGMFLADLPETHTHGCRHGFLWVRVWVCSKKPMDYPCISLVRFILNPWVVRASHALLCYRGHPR